MKQAQMSSIGVAFIRAVGMLYPEDKRLIEDPFANTLLPPLYSLIVKIMQHPGRFKALMKLREKQTPGFVGWILNRTRSIDDILIQTIKEKKITTIVNLGAGMDTRAYRIPGIEHLMYFEVDHPKIIAYKKAKLMKVLKTKPTHVTFVPIDFDTQNLSNELGKSGFNPAHKTLFIWEGVTQYITSQANDSTFSYVSKTAPGSAILFTYIKQSFIDGTDIPPDQNNMHSIVLKEKNPLWIHGYDPSTLKKYLSDFSLKLIQDIGKKEVINRYVRPLNIDLPVLDIERLAYAEIPE